MSTPLTLKNKHLFHFMTVLCVLLSVWSCKKDAMSGALEVIVIGTLGNPVVNAEVILESISSESFQPLTRTTDRFGSAFFEYLPFQNFQAAVTVNGKTLVLPLSIFEDRVQIITLQVDDIPGRDPGLFLSEYPNPVSVADSIFFSAIVDDDRTPASAILVEWNHIINNQEVEIFSGFAAAFNEVSFFYGGLLLGENQFTVRATDSDGRFTQESIQVVAE